MRPYVSSIKTPHGCQDLLCLCKDKGFLDYFWRWNGYCQCRTVNIKWQIRHKKHICFSQPFSQRSYWRYKLFLSPIHRQICIAFFALSPLLSQLVQFYYHLCWHQGWVCLMLDCLIRMWELVFYGRVASLFLKNPYLFTVVKT